MTSLMGLLHRPPASALHRGLGTAVRFLLLFSGVGAIAPAAQAIAPTSQPPLGQAASPASETTPDSDSPRFGCEQVEGDYVVMYYPESQPGQSYAWAKPAAMGGGWSPERRCTEISRRLEFYRPDGLQEMQTSVENGYDIVCVTTEQDPRCRIVLTVPPGQDPLMTRDRVFENLAVADSGQSTSAVNTFTGSNAGELVQQIGEALNIRLPNLSHRTFRARRLDLRPFLDRNDGGTGTRLQRSL